MHRLFVAIDPPPAVKDALTRMMGGIIGARWRREDQLHLTLRFIGEVDTHTANGVAECLATIRQPAFDIGGRGVGIFDRRGRVDSLWIGVEPHEPLKALHNKVDRALARVGITPDTRSYLPHITIARFPRGAGSLDAFMRDAGGVHFAPFRADAFRLFESRLTSDGARYAVVERYPLSADPSPAPPASRARLPQQA